MFTLNSVISFGHYQAVDFSRRLHWCPDHLLDIAFDVPDLVATRNRGAEWTETMSVVVSRGSSASLAPRLCQPPSLRFAVHPDTKCQGLASRRDMLIDG